jgi:hypothetical protein
VIARADIKGALQRVLQRLVEAAPIAWRYDPLFRGASIGAGVTLALILLRVAGPHNPALDAPATTMRYVPGVGMQRSAAQGVPPTAPPTDLPKIAPGHPLNDATVIPVPDSDRFGTFTPGKHP